MRKNESTKRDPSPETSSHVSDFRRVAAPVSNEVRNDPTRDRDFGALVSEDKQGAHDGVSVVHCLLELLHFRRSFELITASVTGCSTSVAAWDTRNVILVISECPSYEEEAEDSES